MAIEYINTGTIANDGTGDALREAFIKVNDNFEELDLRAIEQTQFENSGSIGAGLFIGREDNVASFRSIVGGTNITVTENASTVTLDVNDALDELLIISDNGAITISSGQSINLQGGSGIETSVAGQTLTVNLDTQNIISRDTAPTLSAPLNANSQNIVNANTINANQFNGPLDGLVFGYDIREFGPYLSGFEFGRIRQISKNAIEYIMYNNDVDFGPLDPEDFTNTVDFGFLEPVPA
jgi:hypothetical protein